MDSLELPHSLQMLFFFGLCVVPLKLLESLDSLIVLHQRLGPLIHLIIIKVQFDAFPLNLLILKLTNIYISKNIPYYFPLIIRKIKMTYIDDTGEHLSKFLDFSSNILDLFLG